MKNLKLKTNLPILILVSVLTCYLVVKDSLHDVRGIISNSNLWILLFALIIVILSDIFKALSLYSISKKCNAKVNLKDMFTLTLETNFFNGITPFALGGQPFQLYLLRNKNKVSYVKGVNILFCDYYVFQITLLLYTVLLYILNLIFHFVELNALMQWFLLIGFLIHFVIFLFLLYVTFSKGKNHKLVKFIVHLLYKIRIVKDEEKTTNEMISKVSEFRKLIADFREDKHLLVKTTFYNFMKLTLYCGVTTLVFMSIGVNDVSIFDSVSAGVFIWCISSFIPIPGATGGMEYSFVTIFSCTVAETLVKSAVILWRFITYFVMIMIGALIFVIVNRKLKKD